MAEGSDVNYWLLILIGAFILLAILGWAIARNRSRSGNEAPMETTERATRENYEEEHRDHERDPGSGL